MRSLLTTFCFLLLATAVAQAQDQESKMLERMMRPNMDLSNPAQNKKFTAVEGTSVDKKFEAKQFSAGDASLSKGFSGARSFLSKAFGTGKYARAEAAASYRKNADLAFANTEFVTQKSALIKQSSFAKKSAATHDYADQRPFVAKGTRQKQLSEQNHPMTIDEVRELLNKNR